MSYFIHNRFWNSPFLECGHNEFSPPIYLNFVFFCNPVCPNSCQAHLTGPQSRVSRYWSCLFSLYTLFVQFLDFFQCLGRSRHQSISGIFRQFGHILFEHFFICFDWQRLQDEFWVYLWHRFFHFIFSFYFHFFSVFSFCCSRKSIRDLVWRFVFLSVLIPVQVQFHIWFVFSNLPVLSAVDF